MKRTEIIKALEHCSNGGNCNKCSEDAKNPRLSREGCMALQMRNALSLINELTAENDKLTINMNVYGLTAKRLAEEKEELTIELNAMRTAANSYKMHYEKLEAENERLRAELEQRPPKLIIMKLPKKGE